MQAIRHIVSLQWAEAAQVANSLLTKAIRLSANDFNYSLLSEDARKAFLEHRIESVAGAAIATAASASWMSALVASNSQFFVAFLSAAACYGLAGILWGFARQSRRK